MPSPLPPSKWPAGGEINNVYCRLIQKEKAILSELEHATNLKKKTPETVTKLIQVRVVGHLMHVAPPPWCDRLVEEFASESSEWDTTILQVADFYINLLFRFLRTDHHQTPATNSHPSRPSFDAQRQEIEQRLSKPPSSHRDAKERALFRDGYRCVLTGRVDYVSKRAGLPISPGPPHICPTQCCHIFSQTANTNINVDEGKREYAASAWALLDRMAPEFKGFYKELNGAGIHRLENVMTMGGDLHTLFDRMDIWLEHEGGENSNTYRVCYPDGMMKSDLGRYGIPDTITFSTPDADTLPVPAPRYLQLHAVCARVAHLSGAAEYVLDVLDRVESGDTVVLAEDGSDAHVLDTLLAAADIHGAGTQARWNPYG